MKNSYQFKNASFHNVNDQTRIKESLQRDYVPFAIELSKVNLLSLKEIDLKIFYRRTSFGHLDEAFYDRFHCVSFSVFITNLCDISKLIVNIGISPKASVILTIVNMFSHRIRSKFEFR